MLLACPVLALETGVVMPDFNSMASFHVLLPITIIQGTVCVEEPALTVRFVTTPLAIVLITIGMREPAVSRRSVILELTLVLAAIGPDDDTPAMPPPVTPLPGVGHAIV